MGETDSIDSSLTLILLGVIGMLLLSVAIIVFFVVYQKRLFAQQDKMRGMEMAYQKDLLQSSIRAQEAERKRVATDLHDGLGSLLSAIRLYVLQLSPEQAEGEYNELLGETKSMVDTAIEQTREISHDLLPSTLERFGVIEAVEDHCKRIQKLTELEVQFSYDRDYQFNQEQNLALYRIIQELTSNTLKHAKASQINISFQTRSPHIKLGYEDNGKGFSPDKIASIKGGLGLKSIESRVNLLQAEMSIQSTETGGFQFELLLPLGVDEPQVDPSQVLS